MMRRLALGVVVAGLVVVGLVAQAGAYLLGFSAPAPHGQSSALDPGRFAGWGPHPVGVRRFAVEEAPVPMTLWYPATDGETDGSSLGYSYGISMLGSGSAVALATYPGVARPAAPPALSGGPYPLVILSHGFGFTASSYAWLAEHLSSHGMVVAAPEHRESLDPGALWRATVDRPRDIRAVLAFVDAEVRSGAEFDGLVDDRSVAVAGHSYGGYAALAAAGARLDTEAFTAACDSASAAGDPLVFLCDALRPRLDDMAERAGLDSVPPTRWPSWSDSRIDAVVSVAGDAAMFGQPGLETVAVPVLAMGGTADLDSPFAWGTRLTYDGVGSDRKVEVALEDAAHLVFAGECRRLRRLLNLVPLGFCSDPGWDRSDARDVTRHYITAFLLAELAQDPEAAQALSAEHQPPPGVGFRTEGY